MAVLTIFGCTDGIVVACDNLKDEYGKQYCLTGSGDKLYLIYGRMDTEDGKRLLEIFERRLPDGSIYMGSKIKQPRHVSLEMLRKSNPDFKIHSLTIEKLPPYLGVGPDGTIPEPNTYCVYFEKTIVQGIQHIFSLHLKEGKMSPCANFTSEQFSMMNANNDIIDISKTSIQNAVKEYGEKPNIQYADCVTLSYENGYRRIF